MEKLKQYFNDLHKIPEIGFDTYKTSKYIENELKRLGYKVITDVAENGLVGVLDSNVDGKTIAIRADMDALEFPDGDGVKNVHACGHDANSAMALCAAKELAEKGIGKGKVCFVFQPAEEKGKGARAMLESGKLPHIDEMAAIHLRDSTELKKGEAVHALHHSGVCILSITIKGLSSHGARPHLGVNAVDAGVLAVNAINAVRANPKVTHSAKVTYFKSHGTAFNTIPETVDMKVDIRAHDSGVLDELAEKVERAAANAATSVGAAAVTTQQVGLSSASYDEELTLGAKNAVIKVLGNTKGELETTGSEDFHLFAALAGIKTAYIGLGADLTPGLHNENMSFDTSALRDGVDILLNFIEERM